MTIFIKLFFQNFLRNVRFVDNNTNFCYKIVECCLVLNKIFEKIISILQFSNYEKTVESSWCHTSIIFGKIFGKIGKNFFEIWENFFEICTTVYKAGLSKVGDLNNLVTKTVIEYPVLTIAKISKNKKFKSPIFFQKNF